MRIGITAAALTWGWLLPVPAQDPVASAVAEDLVRREKLRAGVDAAFETFRRPVEDGAEHLDNAVTAIEELTAMGLEVVPYLVNELEQERRDTFDFSAWALGMMPGAESEQALRAAVERAESEPTRSATVRKAMACWALGLHGRADAVDLLNEGRHRSAYWAIHSNTPVIEVVSAFTAPDSLPLLLAQLERYGADPALGGERRWTLRALRRLADPRSVPAIAALLDDPSDTMRHDAVFALGNHPAPAAREALLGALADEEVAVRRTSAMSLERLRFATLDVERLSERLAVETDALTRGALYRMLDTYGDREQRDRLYDYWGAAKPLDRQRLVETLAPRADRRSFELVERALVDPDNGVALAAVQALSKLGTREAETRLVEALPRVSWTAAQILAEEATRTRLTRAAPAATERLLAAARVSEAREVASAVITADKLGRLLVRLGYHAAAPKIERAAEELAASTSQGTSAASPETLELLAVYRRTAADLALIRALGSEVSAWIEPLNAADPDHRALAIAELARIGTEPATRPLVSAFDSAEPADRVSILRELVGHDTPSARALIERVLLDPAFDPAKRQSERDWAAWAARELGGEPMRQLLERSVERRNGRDARVLFYAALVEPARGAALVARFRLPRMRYLSHTRGAELEALDWFARYLAAGQSVAEYDVPPSKLMFL